MFVLVIELCLSMKCMFSETPFHLASVGQIRSFCLDCLFDTINSFGITASNSKIALTIIVWSRSSGCFYASFSACLLFFIDHVALIETYRVMPFWHVKFVERFLLMVPKRIIYFQYFISPII